MSSSDYREIRLRDGRALAYAEFGSPGGRPIIHCHGTPSSRVEGDLFFAGTVAAELGVRIIVPDRPGMGHSDFQTGRRIVDWPKDVLELATALSLDTFAVLGSSGGAPYAAACGVQIPDRIRMMGLLWRCCAHGRAWRLCGDDWAPSGDGPARPICPSDPAGFVSAQPPDDTR